MSSGRIDPIGRRPFPKPVTAVDRVVRRDPRDAEEERDAAEPRRPAPPAPPDDGRAHIDVLA